MSRSFISGLHSYSVAAIADRIEIISYLTESRQAKLQINMTRKPTAECQIRRSSTVYIHFYLPLFNCERTFCSQSAFFQTSSPDVHVVLRLVKSSPLSKLRCVCHCVQLLRHNATLRLVSFFFHMLRFPGFLRLLCSHPYFKPFTVVILFSFDQPSVDIEYYITQVCLAHFVAKDCYSFV